jgi:hypothetical protein
VPWLRGDMSQTCRISAMQFPQCDVRRASFKTGTVRFARNALGRHEIFLRFGASSHQTERWHQIIPVKTANLIEKNVTER